MAPDTLATVDTWPSLVRHIFDSVWGTVGASVASLLAGWLLLKRPAAVERLMGRPSSAQPEASDTP